MGSDCLVLDSSDRLDRALRSVYHHITSAYLVERESSIRYDPIEREYLEYARRHPRKFDINLDVRASVVHDATGFDFIRLALSNLLKVSPTKLALSGSFLYRSGDFMGWHTNVNSPGTRVYATYSDTGDSDFRYWDGTDIQVTADAPGITVRQFCSLIDDPLWHCVSSRCNRLSVGFKIN